MFKLVSQDRKAFIDDMLKRITESLQLSASKRKLVEERYGAVSNFIEQSEGLFQDADIYAQGSYRLGTTVRPRQGGEFDLDFVVQINKDWRELPFNHIYNDFRQLMESNGNWGHLVEPKSRCIQLNYADEFHMDIIPTCTENQFGDKNRIMVPDRAEHNWVISNPEGYALWFKNKYIDQKDIYLHNFYPGMEIRAAQELPKDDPNHLKQPLQHAVQLVKRYRDIYFENREDLAPSSIVLTTLIAQLYTGESSIYDTINNFVQRFKASVAHERQYSRQFHVINPVLPQEIFTKKWETNPKLFYAFIEFVNSLSQLWQEINEATGNDLFELLKKSFGTGAFEDAYKKHGEFVAEMRKKARTGINRETGMAVGFGGAGVHRDKQNTFHGGRLLK